MQKIAFLTLLSSLSLFAHTLTIEVTNIKNNSGQILMGLFNQVEGFRDVNMTYKKSVITTLNKNIVYIFTDIPDGEYAVSLFHDENNNDKIDTNFIGIPKEGYGVSNNIHPTLRAPTFEETKFQLSTDTNLTIEMNY